MPVPSRLLGVATTAFGLLAATLFRTASDLTDAVVFGINAPGRARKGRALGATPGYAALAAQVLRRAGR